MGMESMVQIERLYIQGNHGELHMITPTMKVKCSKDLPISTALLATVYKKEYLFAVLDSLYLGSSFTDYRRYHTLDHIDWCLKQLVLVEDEDIRQPISGKPLRLELELAILFHDAVCIPGSKINEHLSADIASGFIQSTCSTTRLESNWITSMIRNTGPMPVEEVYGLNPVEQILRDIDHSILGSTWETYQKYNTNVRREYMTTMMPEWMFNKGRIDFLTDMINRADKNRLFTTKRFSLLNPIAQINMIKERNWLESLKHV